ncbi:hypothetical protein KC19_3G092500 [Ceratodon purpureus]|uniref:F-box domain-containing protein n=1 Tax=Ceratodon purpureus TaxID=3225 RepID=A0A8T0IGI1_CERPU|nr:hypothetical protein KC19_3G092500 [Ceratodon purpureus]
MEMEMERAEDAFVHTEVDTGVGQSVSVGLDAALWSTLPKELIRFICARLPLPKLLRLQHTARVENWKLNLDDSEFRQLCAKTHTNMCAIMVPEYGSGVVFNLELHSGESVLWRKLKLPIEEPDYVSRGRSNIMSSADGGLVCFALKFQSPENEETMVILVVNPLTGDCKELPAHGMCPVELKMMQLVMDRETKLYQVILVGPKSGNGGGTQAMLYHSGTGVWANAKEFTGLFFGLQYCFYVSVMKYDMIGPCVYDCAAEKLHCLDRDTFRSIYISNHRVDVALLQDHFFALTHEDHGKAGHLQNYGLCEYQIQLQQDGVRCLKLKDHHEVQTELLVSGTENIWLCKGFLLLTGCRANLTTDPNDVPIYGAWLCNMSTGDWLEIQSFSTFLGDWQYYFDISTNLLCELQWDAVP